MSNKIEIELEHSKETRGTNRFDYMGDDLDVPVTALYVRKPFLKGVKKIVVTLEPVDGVVCHNCEEAGE
jgi:hypothetical protein